MTEGVVSFVPPEVSTVLLALAGNAVEPVMVATTWKPRLFVLRGRRLSYYYSEDDTEERGLIDITGPLPSLVVSD
jgi:hypothetical protein